MYVWEVPRESSPPHGGNNRALLLLCDDTWIHLSVLHALFSSFPVSSTLATSPTLQIILPDRLSGCGRIKGVWVLGPGRREEKVSCVFCVSTRLHVVYYSTHQVSLDRLNGVSFETPPNPIPNPIFQQPVHSPSLVPTNHIEPKISKPC